MTEVWLLWCEETIPFAEPANLIDIFSTEEIAQKHCDEENGKLYDFKLQEWRVFNKKRPDEFPDEDLKLNYNYYILAWDVSTE